MFGAKLLHHYPGTLTAIEIPMNDEYFGVISFNSIVNSLVSESARSSTTIEASDSTASVSQPNLPVFTEPKHRVNPYENIIERLERKYTSHMIVCDEESDENDEKVMEDVEDEMGDEKNDTKISKRKRRSNLYEYDFDGKLCRSS